MVGTSLGILSQMAYSRNSLCERFEDLMALNCVLQVGCEEEFIKFLRNQDECRLKWQAAEKDIQMLQDTICNMRSEIVKSTESLQREMQLLREEKERNEELEIENQAKEHELTNLLRLLMPQRNILDCKTQQEIQLLRTVLLCPRERRSSYIQKPEYSNNFNCTVSPQSILAEKKLLDVHSPKNKLTPDYRIFIKRNHSFVERFTIKSEFCCSCGKRIKFGRKMAKCHLCKIMTHIQCKENISEQCFPKESSPNLRKGIKVSICDYTPIFPPMVPSIIIHCINEIESRGLKAAGIYNDTGSAVVIRNLEAKFFSGELPDLSEYQTPVLCGVIKNFFFLLHEPLIPYTLWSHYISLEDEFNPKELLPYLQTAVSELPRENHDTLAFLIMHLQKVASCPDNEMSISNLAMVFGSVIMRCSSSETSPSTRLKEENEQQKVLEALLKIPSEHWASVVGNKEPTSTSKDDLNFRSSNVLEICKTPEGCFGRLDTGYSRKFFRKSLSPTKSSYYNV